MLKDITLGQFFPGNTIVHRLDPRTKLMAVILYSVEWIRCYLETGLLMNGLSFIRFVNQKMC